jgi:hypothetical protein
VHHASAAAAQTAHALHMEILAMLGLHGICPCDFHAASSTYAPSAASLPTSTICKVPSAIREVP